MNGNSIPESELTDEMKSLEVRLGRIPTSRDMNSKGKFDASTYERRFGCWNSALEESGLERINERYIPSSDLVSHLKELSDEIGRKPKVEDMRRFGRFGSTVYYDRFGSWDVALEKAGFIPRHQSDWVLSGEDSPKWRGGTQDDYGSNWREKRRKCRKRDGYKCQSCGVSEEDYRKEHDISLDVHHIIPRKEFDKVEDSNRLDNLILLCRKCHRKAESGKLEFEYNYEDHNLT